jgi:flagellar protein FliJ
MTKWANSLVRISNHEVETLQKRLAEIVGRRAGVEHLIRCLDDEVAFECDNRLPFEEAGFYLAGFREGATQRRARFEAQLLEIAAEEEGARDALSEAFETLKKYEHVVEAAKLAAAKEELRLETVALDELGLRKRAR